MLTGSNCKERHQCMAREHPSRLKNYDDRVHFPGGFSSLDASRPWIAYWATHSLNLLQLPHNRAVPPEALVATLASCQHPSGGFGGGPYQLAHLAPTCAPILSVTLKKAWNAFSDYVLVETSIASHWIFVASIVHYTSSKSNFVWEIHTLFACILVPKFRWGNPEIRELDFFSKLNEVDLGILDPTNISFSGGPDRCMVENRITGAGIKYKNALKQCANDGRRTWE